jgi:redox-sensitive bicupin YhaK (pirin superfamily)
VSLTSCAIARCVIAAVSHARNLLVLFCTMSTQLELVVRSRERDIGGFSVRRLLPYATHRMVGPFIFFDHVGPAEFPKGHGMDVRPHPHMNLATVTYVFEGRIRHRDSLGSDQVIEPGDINWMIAGRGIVHSERTPAETRASGSRMHAIQCWVAYPDEFEEIDPHFSHHPKSSLPEFKIGDVNLKLLLGTAFGKTSPVPVHMDIFYVEAKMPAGSELVVPSSGREAAAHVVSGRLQCEDEILEATAMGIAKSGHDLHLRALEDSVVMLLGGKAIGKRFIFWNLVSSSEERIEQAKKEWALGPGHPDSRFPLIEGDSDEFIPLPAEPGVHQKKEEGSLGSKPNPKGTSF